MEMDCGLDDANLAQRRAAGYRVGLLEGYDRLGSHPSPGGLLGRRDAGQKQRQPERGDCSQSDSATAARTGVIAARRKSRFMRVIVSMLISLGQASWHSP